MSEKLLKQPNEAYTIAFEFAGKLPSGASLSTGTVSAIRLDTGATDNSVLASTTATIVGTQARVKIQAGTSGVDYEVTFLVTLSTGDVLEEDVIMQVINL
ncbi:MAG: hypothetical protein H8K07_01700 [Nitrospira sp.]|nr:hypothetical protein [Nitrospira sp.]